MSTNLIALFVILVLSTVVFAFASRPSYAIIPRADFVRRRNLWFTLTLILFLVNNVWIYILISSVVLLYSNKRESNPVALYFLLLLVAPPFIAKIPGMGMVNFLFSLSHQRLMVLVILVPLFFALSRQKNTVAFGKSLPDKLLAAYLIYMTILFFRDTTITNSLRQIFGLFIDIFIPYYVISRFVTDLQRFREALLCFVISIMICAMIGMFELVSSWPLYFTVEMLFREAAYYFERGGMFRASASSGPIPLGYVITVGIGFFIFLLPSIRSGFSRRGGMLLLIGGLLSTLSRGPWAGAVFLYLVFAVTGRQRIRKLFKYAMLGLAGLFVVAILPLKIDIIDLIPFIGTSAQESVSYREQLTEKALIVIKRNPFFGSSSYLSTPELESMRQGQGIIDIVNAYLEITLASGFIGLGLFAGLFISICWGIFRRFQRIGDSSSEEHLLGRSLLATLSAILLIIVTVSSTSVIPAVYWSVAGLGAAYIHLAYSSGIVSVESSDEPASDAIGKVQTGIQSRR